jgi:hypothetical protein
MLGGCDCSEEEQQALREMLAYHVTVRHLLAYHVTVRHLLACHVTVRHSAARSPWPDVTVV